MEEVGRLRHKGRVWFKTLSYNQSGLQDRGGKKLLLSKVGAIQAPQEGLW